MSDPTARSQESASFESRMEILTQELDLAIRWQRPAILLVAYGSVYVRDDSVSMLENFLMDCGQRIVWISAGDSAVNTLEFWERVLEDAREVVFFLDGFTDLAYQRGLMGILDRHSYLFSKACARLVFWLTYKEASLLAYHAPSVWNARQRLVELAAAPRPEQILQSTLESAWQGTGEYPDQVEDTDAGISLRESFLSGMPVNGESTAIRANLMLTLGILHWRKGDYEKAEEMLQNALKAAPRIDDALFEAKCLNAIALVQAGLGRNEEAIDSYRQAIKLAPDQIFAWNNLGNLCLKIGRNHEALIAFQKAVEHNPSDPIAWNGLGDVYTHSGYADEAGAAYRKAIELSPALPHPWNGLGEVHAQSGRFDDAVISFQKAIKLNERFIQPWLGLARLYARHERHRDASRAYEQALTIDPQNSAVWNDLGCVYIEGRRYREAVDALSRALELDRGFGWAYSNLALAHVGLEKIAESVPLYLKSLDLLKEPGQRTATWNRLANSYRLLNDYDNAIKAYQMADSHTPNPSLRLPGASTAPQPDPVSEADPAPKPEPAPGMERSEDGPIPEQIEVPETDAELETPYWIFQSESQPEDLSAQLFQSATATQKIGGSSMQMILPFTPSKQVSRSRKLPAETGNARIWNEKGNLFLRAGAFEDAIQAYNKAIKIDRSFGWSYTNLGIAYLQMGRYAEAVLLLQKSLELLKTDGERAVVWNELGNMYRCLNDYRNATLAYQKADELDPEHGGERDTVEYLHTEPGVGNARVWHELGDTFFRSGAYSEASNCYRKLTEMTPLNAQAFSNLALSLTFEARFEEAIPHYRRSIELFKDDREKADAWNRLGNVYRRLNDYDNAIAAYQNAVKLNHEDATLLTRTRFSLLGNCNVD